MQLTGTLQGKHIHYTAGAAHACPPHFLALVLAGKYRAKTQAADLQAIVGHEPLFIYCLGPDFTDMEDAVADLLCEKYPGFDDDTVMPMTFGGNDLREALDFCANDAFHEEKPIEHIVVFDLGEEKTGPQPIQKTIESLPGFSAPAG